MCTSSKKINVIYHCDDLYIDYLIVSIFSAHVNNNNICFHIVTNCNYSNVRKILSIAEKHNIEIKIYAVSYVLFEEYNIPKKFKRLYAKHPIKTLYELTKHQYINEIPFTAAPLFYFVFHQYLFSFDKGIFLDCDTIIDCNLEELYNINFGSKIAIMCEDWSRSYVTYRNKKYKAYNGGVSVTKIKEMGPYWEKMYDHVLNNLDWAKLGLQHSMNVICQDIILPLDKKWNTSVKHLDGTPNIYHYNTIIKHPELKDSLYKKYENSCNR